MKLSRRMLLHAMLGAAAAVPLSSVAARRALAGPAVGKAKRLIVFYFPDGIPEPEGAASRWHMSGTNTSFALVDTLSPLEAHKGQCLFFNGLTMGPTDAGSHPGGAKKLLTAFDGGNGPSIDQHLARTVGASAPFPVVLLGSASTFNNASGDKFISYPSAGAPLAPEDDPRKAFQRLFGGAAPGSRDAGGGDDGTKSVIDTNLAELSDLRARLGLAEQSKLDLHVEALRDLEKRLQGGGSTPAPLTCGTPQLDTSGFDVAQIFAPEKFPSVLRAQIDVMVQAMACGLTQVGVVQASQHTSELIMSRFAGSEMYDAASDMRSHQASHYGQTTDSKYDTYVKQRRWFVSQFAYLLDQLASRPEGVGPCSTNRWSSCAARSRTEIPTATTTCRSSLPVAAAAPSAPGASSTPATAATPTCTWRSPKPWETRSRRLGTHATASCPGFSSDATPDFASRTLGVKGTVRPIGNPQ